ncbi:MAG: WD40 repeat domain-containing protein, partial [Methermicoccaceae archaeon]
MGKAVWVVIFIVLFMLPTSGVAVSDESVATLEGHSDTVRSVAFSPDGKLVASGSNDGTVKLWNVSTRGYVATLEFNGPVLSVAFSPDGKLLASGSDDRTVKLWNVSTRENVRMLTGHWGPVLSVAF